MPIRKALLATTMLAGIVGSACSIGVAHAADAAVPFYKAPPLPEPAVDGFNAKWKPWAAL
jgi:hypothetical protein